MSDNTLPTNESIQKAEQELGLLFPEDYKHVLLSYPFEIDSYNYEWLLFGELDAVIHENKEVRDLGFFGPKWPNNYLIIGGDGLGNQYYLDLTRQPSPVFLADHEATSGSTVIEAEEIAPSLTEWIEQIIREEASDNASEIETQRQIDELRANKKWWQFWL